ncbi:sugar phosphate isomerase/epimerase family protein [Tepidibacter aestuarii]|uniref:sugar phosphate isomerase/epimerase family protein n=1 Tax=Tepidibacter aestuarii TaxID=2925782 RepID=UPI0020BDEAC3|nr:sugar phosphate isomerase/epimerase family protein [Tepidibacter aestuarii]CAH2214576.1 3-oxo-isoapionate decarboxylase [Tepidibacter aestuarii]
MRIGLETESYHLAFQNGLMDIFGFIRKTAELGLDGVMINIIALPGDKYIHPEWGTLGGEDPDHLERVRKEIKKYGLFAEIDTRGTDPQHLTKVINVANTIGADVIRTYCCFNGYERERLERAPEDIKKIVPLLKRYRIKLAVENHEEETADEVIKIVKEVNSPWVGVHCDIGNSMMAWEEPVDAVRKLAPYAYTTHFKDHIIIKDEDQYRVCGVPVGKGNIDLEKCFEILVNDSTLTRINIEMCYPYVSIFKREKGTGGVSELGKGAFKVEETPFDPSVIKPSQYYYPPEEHLISLLKAQMKGVEESVKYVLGLRDKYCR